ncbi:cell wall protein IFF7-like [Osmia bicornis bicornis]|uniref:cell wall protein IFF7-like n=1 Tax=Osmia bicornis bicornis TaxID=1437191 RepID=UPI001EAE9140|nr:cell wall protein IFF7-like [Osmia bicornis bicornis]
MTSSGEDKVNIANLEEGIHEIYDIEWSESGSSSDLDIGILDNSSALPARPSSLPSSRAFGVTKHANKGANEAASKELSKAKKHKPDVPLGSSDNKRSDKGYHGSPPALTTISASSSARLPAPVLSPATSTISSSSGSATKKERVLGPVIRRCDLLRPPRSETAVSAAAETVAGEKQLGKPAQPKGDEHRNPTLSLSLSTLRRLNALSECSVVGTSLLSSSKPTSLSSGAARISTTSTLATMAVAGTSRDARMSDTSDVQTDQRNKVNFSPTSSIVILNDDFEEDFNLPAGQNEVPPGTGDGSSFQGSTKPSLFLGSVATTAVGGDGAINVAGVTCGEGVSSAPAAPSTSTNAGDLVQEHGSVRGDVGVGIDKSNIDIKDKSIITKGTGKNGFNDVNLENNDTVYLNSNSNSNNNNNNNHIVDRSAINDINDINDNNDVVDENENFDLMRKRMLRVDGVNSEPVITTVNRATDLEGPVQNSTPPPPPPEFCYRESRISCCE